MSEPVLSVSADAQEPQKATAYKPAHVIIVGNEKGGSGKTTTTMHLIVALLRLGFTVGSMDIDARQRSLSRYIENRRQTITRENSNLPLPHHIVIQKSPFHLLQEAQADERERFLKGLARIYYSNDFVVIDTPGSDTYLARLAHSFADTVITPINDSFVDLDVLANVDGQTMKVIKPSIYSEMVWEQKLSRAKRDGGTIEWIVMRNRLSNIDARNKRNMTNVLNELSRRIGFRVAPGFSERVIFREMFLQGLTVLDVESQTGGLSLSHIAARQEVRDLLKILRNPVVDERIAEMRTVIEGTQEAEAAASNASSAAETVTPALEAAPADVRSQPVLSSSETTIGPRFDLTGSSTQEPAAGPLLEVASEPSVKDRSMQASTAKKDADAAYRFAPTILREYDIRGIVGETLSAADAYAIGRSFASFRPEWKTKAPKIAVCRDGRLSSPELEAALVKGLNDAGADVVRLPVGPTPMLYFAVTTLGLGGGIMVTGSHNPPSHNGFKFMLGKKSFYGEDIQKLGEIAASGAYHSGKGAVEENNIEPAYIAALVKAAAGGRRLKVAWDAGNGAAGRIAKALTEKLPGEHVALYTEIDGTFPNHHPDPSVPATLKDLIRTVREGKCDFGVAFDGDGDRIGAVDETGEILFGDQLLAILAATVLAKHPGATIIADVKASEVLFDEIARLGGVPLMWKTGHSLIKTKMAETGAKLAGEMSGHMFFADDYYGFDDGLYAAVRLFSLLASGKETLSSLRARLPKTHSTPELRIDCADERKFAVMDAVKKRLASEKAKFSDVDGVRVSTADGWWLLRASNTQAALVARCESKSQEGLARLEENLSAALSVQGVAMKLAAGH